MVKCFLCVCVCIEDGNRVLATRSWHGLIVFHLHIFLLIQIHKFDRKTLFRSRQFSTKYCKKMRSYVMHCLLDIVHVRVMLNATFSRQKNILCVPLALSLTHTLCLFVSLFCLVNVYSTTCFDFAVISICKNLNAIDCDTFLLLVDERERECVHTERHTFCP